MSFVGAVLCSLAVSLSFLRLIYLSRIVRVEKFTIGHWNYAVLDGISYDDDRDYARLHALGLKCLQDSKSPYGYHDIPMHTRAERNAEYHRLLNFTAQYRDYPNYCWAGWCGPWDEDQFISEFCCDKSIDTFGPYIPVFVPWTRIYKVANRSVSTVKYPDVIRPILQTLRRDFLYITVNHCDYGVEGMGRSLNPDVPPNLLVVSSSGLGHIPILLHIRPQEWVDPLPRSNRIGFLGKLSRWKRRKVVHRWKAAFQENLTIAAKVPNWTEYYRQFDLVLSPRGNARGCFRTTEVLEMGLIPIIAFRYRLWVPYLNSSLPWDDIAFISRNSDIKRLQPIINSLTQERISFMRQNVRKYKYTHFTLNATMNQLRMFMQSGYDHSDLRCGEYYDAY